MIQQTILFNGFISALPQEEAMMAEPGQEGKRTSEKERGQVQEFSRFQQQDWTPPQLSWLTIRRDDVLSRV